MLNEGRTGRDHAQYTIARFSEYREDFDALARLFATTGRMGHLHTQALAVHVLAKQLDALSQPYQDDAGGRLEEQPAARTGPAGRMPERARDRQHGKDIASARPALPVTASVFVGAQRYRVQGSSVGAGAPVTRSVIKYCNIKMYVHVRNWRTCVCPDVSY